MTEQEKEMLESLYRMKVQAEEIVKQYNEVIALIEEMVKRRKEVEGE